MLYFGSEKGRFTGSWRWNTPGRQTLAGQPRDNGTWWGWSTGSSGSPPMCDEAIPLRSLPEAGFSVILLGRKAMQNKGSS